MQVVVGKATVVMDKAIHAGGYHIWVVILAIELCIREFEGKLSSLRMSVYHYFITSV